MYRMNCRSKLRDFLCTRARIRKLYEMEPDPTINIFPEDVWKQCPSLFNALNVTFLLWISHQPFITIHVRLLCFLPDNYSTDDYYVSCLILIQRMINTICFSVN